jgi:hypothetical protein
MSELEEGGKALKIFPNPLNEDELKIEYLASGDAWVTVFNQSGVKVLTDIIRPGAGTVRVTLPGPAGLYLVRIVDGARIFNRVVLKTD